MHRFVARRRCLLEGDTYSDLSVHDAEPVKKQRLFKVRR